MGDLKVGAFLGSFRMDVRSSLKKAQEIGLDGVQLSNVKDELIIEELTETGIKEVSHLVQSHSLVISAVNGSFIGGYAVDKREDVEERVEKSKKIMDITVKLGCSIVQTHIGLIPEDETSEIWQTMTYALDKVGSYGEKVGCSLATETGPESPELMRRFLDSIKRETIKVNYDPANLVMKGFDHLGGVKELSSYIIHTHAKDGKRNDGEVPLGEGDVNFAEYIKALREIGYDGFFVIEREVGEDPAGDIAKAKKFLDRF